MKEGEAISLLLPKTQNAPPSPSSIPRFAVSYYRMDICVVYAMHIAMVATGGGGVQIELKHNTQSNLTRERRRGGGGDGSLHNASYTWTLGAERHHVDSVRCERAEHERFC